MRAVKKLFIRTFQVLAGLYILVCLVLYFFQENIIFFPEKLPSDYVFSFSQPFEEITVATSNHHFLHALLFKTDSAKGLIFYLHGNAGSLRDWGNVAQLYTRLHYNVFLLDYPSYGKSDGAIESQQQLFNGIQNAYNIVKQRIHEDSIVVLGYSIGTGPAAHLASANHPRLLILQAPYYSLTDMMRHSYPFVPTFLLKYKLPTNEYLRTCRMPVVIFHGDNDEVIYYGSSLRLQTEMKSSDTLITLPGQGHNGITDNPDYIRAIQTILQ